MKKETLTQIFSYSFCEIFPLSNCRYLCKEQNIAYIVASSVNITLRKKERL